MPGLPWTGLALSIYLRATLQELIHSSTKGDQAQPIEREQRKGAWGIFNDIGVVIKARICMLKITDHIEWRC